MCEHDGGASRNLVVVAIAAKFPKLQAIGKGERVKRRLYLFFKKSK